MLYGVPMPLIRSWYFDDLYDRTTKVKQRQTKQKKKPNEYGDKLTRKSNFQTMSFQPRLSEYALKFSPCENLLKSFSFRLQNVCVRQNVLWRDKGVMWYCLSILSNKKKKQAMIRTCPCQVKTILSEFE